MKKRITFVLGLLITLLVNAQNVEFTGSWLMVKINNNGIDKKENTAFNFTKDGNVKTRGFEFATWKFNSAKKEVLLKSSFSGKEFNGVHKVLTLTAKQLVFSKDKVTYYFERIDLEKTIANNKASNLEGTWVLNHEVFDPFFVKFMLPNNVKIITSLDGMTTSEKGNWEYNPKAKTVKISDINHLHVLFGETEVKAVTESKLTLASSRDSFNFTKVKKEAIEWLNFTQNDFLESDNKELPEQWKNPDNVFSSLGKIKSLTYNFGSYLEQAEALKFEKILKKITYKSEGPSLSVANNLVTKIDTLQFSENYKGNLLNNNNVFFPEEEPNYYKVIGEELLKTKAGDFNCTVVEAINGRKKLKYWMINNQPGVYAKKIEQYTNSFNKLEYSVITLTNILK